MKRIVKFVDEANVLFTVEVEIKEGKCSFSGDSGNSCGQLRDSINPRTDSQKTLVELWERWHLNGIKAGTPKQMEALKNKPKGWDSFEYLKVLKPNGEGLSAVEQRVLYIADDENQKEYEIQKMLIDRFTKEALRRKNGSSWIEFTSTIVFEALLPIIEKHNLHTLDTGSYKLWADAFFSKKGFKRSYEDFITNFTKDLLVKPKRNLGTLYWDNHPETGELYSYGSAWLKMDLPDDFEDTLDELLDTIEEEEEERKGEAKISELTEEQGIELFSEFDSPEAAYALAYHLELSVSEVEDVEEGGEGRWSVQGTDYVCGNEDEVIDLIYEYMSDSLWCFNPSFLEDYGALDKMGWTDVTSILTALQEQCEGANDAIKALVDWDKTGGTMATDVFNADGIGNILNGWDGNDYEITVSNTTYYICRT